MKSIITTVIATLFILLPVTVFAEGGYNWEKNAEKREMSHKMNMSSHMDHSNSGHGSMMKDSKHGSVMKRSSGMGNGHAQNHGSSHAKNAENMKSKHSGKK